MLISCNPAKHAINFFDNHKEPAALYCAIRFPVKDQVIVRDSVHFDTLFSAGDTVQVAAPCPDGIDTVLVRAACPPVRTITKIINHDSLIIRRDFAAETVLQNNITSCYKTITEREDQIRKLSADLSKAKKQRNWWMIACLITWGMIAGGIALKVMKKIPGVLLMG